MNRLVCITCQRSAGGKSRPWLKPYRQRSTHAGECCKRSSATLWILRARVAHGFKRGGGGLGRCVNLGIAPGRSGRIYRIRCGVGWLITRTPLCICACGTCRNIKSRSVCRYNGGKTCITTRIKVCQHGTRADCCWNIKRPGRQGRRHGHACINGSRLRILNSCIRTFARRDPGAGNSNRLKGCA